MKKNETKKALLNKKNLGHSKHNHNKRLLKSIVAIVVIIMALAIGVTAEANHMNHWSHHTVTHLETNQRVKHISTNNNMINNKNVNGKYTIYFYMDNCPHCEHAIPRAYVHNKLTPTQWFNGSHTQYRDIIGHINNANLAQDAHITEVPTKVQMTFENGRIIHTHKMSKLY